MNNSLSLSVTPMPVKGHPEHKTLMKGLTFEGHKLSFPHFPGGFKMKKLMSLLMFFALAFHPGILFAESAAKVAEQDANKADKQANQALGKATTPDAGLDAAPSDLEADEFGDWDDEDFGLDEELAETDEFADEDELEGDVVADTKPAVEKEKKS
jgi:hypothetical protein